MKKSIFGVTLDELKSYTKANNYSEAKARFLYKVIYGQTLDATRENVPDELMAQAQKDFDFSLPEKIEASTSTDAWKYLFRLSDGCMIETVVMKYVFGIGICVSTQVGCNMGCAFCESGRLKKQRNLTEAEIVAQVVAVAREQGEYPRNIVLMGIGEPLDNYDNVKRFLNIICDPFGAGFGSRHITLSTCGIVPKMRELLQTEKINLAVSLHAPNDELRNKLMPINRRYPISEILSTIKECAAKSNINKVTFEYLLIDGVNDSDECAYELVELLKGVNGYVNLIPYNAPDDCEHEGGDKTAKTEEAAGNATVEVAGNGSKTAPVFRKSSIERKRVFFDILKQNGCMATVRREFGSNMNAACGQLRAKKM